MNTEFVIYRPSHWIKLAMHSPQHPCFIFVILLGLLLVSSYKVNHVFSSYKVNSFHPTSLNIKYKLASHEMKKFQTVHDKSVLANLFSIDGIDSGFRTKTMVIITNDNSFCFSERIFSRD